MTNSYYQQEIFEEVDYLKQHQSLHDAIKLHAEKMGLDLDLDFDFMQALQHPNGDMEVSYQDLFDENATLHVEARLSEGQWEILDASHDSD